MKKLCLLLLCLVLICVCAVGAGAEEIKIVMSEPISTGIDFDPLEEYTRRIFEPDDDVNAASASLAGIEQIAYNELLDAAQKLVAGKDPEGSTFFPVLANYYQGLSQKWVLTEAEVADPDLWWDGLNQRYGFDFFKVASAAFQDHPELFFWSSEGVTISLSLDDNGVIHGIWIIPLAGNDYCGENNYAVDVSSMLDGAGRFAVVNKAKQKADSIVQQGAGKTTVERMRYYAETICELVTYDTAAAARKDGKEVYYMEPWKYVAVFDGDASTNVVCEGYAKAFKYLCDLTFDPSELEVICVTGTTNGPHMWNVVNMPDGNYLVDVTNMDSGWTCLFMEQTKADENGWMHFRMDERNEISYQYSDMTLQIFAPEDLDLCYVPQAPKVEINLWSFANELENIMNLYLERHPELAEKYTVNNTVQFGDSFTGAIGDALAAGNVDIFSSELDFVSDFVSGRYSDDTVPYASLGIDMSRISAAQIAPYSVQVGTAPSGAVKGLSYQSTIGAFFYRRSIAREVFGSDAPSVVAAKIGAGTGDWNAFAQASRELNQAGYRIISGKNDYRPVMDASGYGSWVWNDNVVHVSDTRRNQMSITRDLANSTGGSWSDDWYNGMMESSNVLGYFGPAWMLNNVISSFSDASDWAVCESNVSFYWGGSWVMAGSGALNPEKKEFVKGFLEWVTLDTSDTGFQYLWASGAMGTKDAVVSNVVMNQLSSTPAILGGQNMFEVYAAANAAASACQYGIRMSSDPVDGLWEDYVEKYASGSLSEYQALTLFQFGAAELLGCKAVDSYPLDTMVLPAELTVIDQEAFQGVSAQKIVLPASVTEIASGAFADMNKLEALVFQEDCASIAEDALAGCSKSVLIFCPAGSQTEQWARSNGYNTICNF